MEPAVKVYNKAKGKKEKGKMLLPFTFYLLPFTLPMTEPHDRAARSAIDLFQRTYRSLLRSSGEIQIEAMVEPYLASEPLLHVAGREATPDAAALIYSALRLPAVSPRCGCCCSAKAPRSLRAMATPISRHGSR